MISASILAARRRKLLEEGRGSHLPRLRNMADYRRAEIGRRIHSRERGFLPQEELGALEWAIELLEDPPTDRKETNQ